MLFNRDTDPSKDDMEAEFPSYSLPELYTFVENFNKESKKLNLLKTHGISPTEAQKILSQTLNAMPFTSEANVREDPQPVVMYKVVRKDQERQASITELLHRSLLNSSLSPLNRISASKQRLPKYGISPPSYTLPCEILTDPSSSLATTQKIQSTKQLPRLGISHVKPKKFTFEDRTSEYLLVDPEKQFMDLRDLQWRYYKGIAKWKHKAADPFVNIQYDSEKRFVESQDVSDVICLPLVRRSLVIYPQVDYPINVTPSS